MLSSNQYY